MDRIKNIFVIIFSKTYILAFALLMFGSGIMFADKNFMSPANILNILLKAAKNGGLLAFGVSFVILCGEIDLSVGSVFALSGVVMGIVGAYNPVFGIIAGISVGVISGYTMGLLVSKAKISSWIVSLAMLFVLRGLILILAKKSVTISDKLLLFGDTKILKGIFGLKSGISILIIILFIIGFMCMYIGRYTKFGMGIYAVGGNEEAAKMMGLNVDRIKISVFVISGFIAALSGMLLASSSGSATLSAGNMYETYAIAMCAIGGIKLSGGEGKFLGTFFGILIYFIINTIFTYLPSDIPVHWQQVIMGVLVLLSVGVQSEAIIHKGGK